MRGSDGERFGARVPLGRHFPLSRDIRGFFHPMHTRVGVVWMVGISQHPAFATGAAVVAGAGQSIGQ
jgi:hypothetical protein